MVSGSTSGSRVSKSLECHGQYGEFVVLATQHKDNWSYEETVDATVFSTKILQG